MMIPAVVAQRYAKALFHLGEEANQLDALVTELARAVSTYESSQELRSALENPLVPHAAKQAIVGEVAQKLSLGASAKNTLLLLTDRRRIRALPAIVRELKVLSDKKRGVVRAVAHGQRVHRLAHHLGDRRVQRAAGQRDAAEHVVARQNAQHTAFGPGDQHRADATVEHLLQRRGQRGLRRHRQRRAACEVGQRGLQRLLGLHA